MRLRLYIILSLTFSMLHGNSQESRKIDSLKVLLEQSKEDKSRLKILNNIIDNYTEKKLFDSVIKYTTQSLHLSKKLDSKVGIAYANYNLGYAYRYSRNDSTFMEYFLNALKILNEFSPNNSLISYIFNSIGVYYYDKENYQFALDYFLKSIATNTKMDPWNKGNTYANVGNAYSALGIKGKVIDYYIQALNIFKVNNYKSDQIRIYKSIGHYYYKQSNLLKALEYYLKPLSIIEDIEDREALLPILIEISAIHTELGNNDSAVYYSLKALRIAEEQKDKHKQAEIYHELGRSYHFMNKYQQSFEYFSKALKIAEELNIGHLRRAANYYISVGYKAQQDYDSAFKYLSKALAIAKEINSKNNVADYLSELGNICSLKKDYLKALKYYNQAIEISNRDSSNSTVIDCIRGIGIVYASLGETKKAESYLLNTLSILNTSQSLPERKNIHDALSDFYSGIGKYKKSLEHEKIASSLKDSMINEKSNAKIAQLQIEYETEKKDREIENLTKDAKIKDLEILQKKQELQAQQLEQEKKQQAIDLLTANKKIQELSLAKKEKEVADLLKDQQIKNLLIQQNSQQIHAQLMEQEKKQQAIDLLLASKQIQQLDLDKKENNIKLLEKTKLLQQSEISRRTNLYIFSLLAIVIVIGLFSLYFRYQQVKKKNITEKRIAQLEQKALQLQMNPHFIFNSLNSIGDFIMHHEAASAQNFLAKFSKLTRAVLEASKETFIPLEKELEILNNYLFLEQVRFNKCFDFNIQLGESIDPEITLLPPMLIQPFVENAILHGVSKLNKKGNITISLDMKEPNKLICQVKDDGIGRSASIKSKSTNTKTEHQSIGITNIEERLKVFSELYSVPLKLEVVDMSENGIGTHVKFGLPIRILYND